MNKMDMVKERRRTVSRRINTVVAVLIIVFNLFSLVGCGESEETQVNADDLSKVTVAWEDVKASLDKTNLTDLYYENATLDQDIEDFNAISFANYDLTNMTSFKDVDYQLAITYGAVAKEDGSVYENAAYDFSFVDNSSNKYYSAVYQPNKKQLSSEGEWFLEDDREQLIGKFIDELNAAMSVK